MIKNKSLPKNQYGCTCMYRDKSEKKNMPFLKEVVSVNKEIAKIMEQKLQKAA